MGLRGPGAERRTPPRERSDWAMRQIVAAVCLEHGFDVESVAPRGWWRGLSSADLERFNAAWDLVEENVANALAIPDDVWEVVLARCFDADWRGEYRRVLKYRPEGAPSDA